jgi:hypothetical protein
MPYRNKTYINDKDSKLQEALDDLQAQIVNVAKQTRSNPEGPAGAPNSPAQLSVSASSGLFTAHIADREDGKSYILEYSTSPTFQNPITVDLGIAKNWSAQLGTQKLHFRVRATHYTGSYSGYVYHGSQQAPSSVQG